MLIALWFWSTLAALAFVVAGFLWWRVDLWLWRRLALRRKAEIQKTLPPGCVVERVLVARDGEVQMYSYTMPWTPSLRQLARALKQYEERAHGEH